jgi:hypothetical protein
MTDQEKIAALEQKNILLSASLRQADAEIEALKGAHGNHPEGQSGETRFIPDAECVQGKCGNATTGCRGVCWARNPGFIIANTAAPAASAGPSSPHHDIRKMIDTAPLPNFTKDDQREREYFDRWPDRPEASAPIGDMQAGERAEFIRQIVLAVAEIADRDSPEDQPEMMLVTSEELQGIVEGAFEDYDEEYDRAALTPSTQPAAASEVDSRDEALKAINEIRNSIIGLQSLNWSEHVYPLVAALDKAGYQGMDYPEARANYGTMLERAVKAEDALEALTANSSTQPATQAPSTQQSAEAASELEFNATRLRNVARLVGIENAIPQDDATLDGARGAVLGQIARALGTARPAEQSAEAVAWAILDSYGNCRIWFGDFARASRWAKELKLPSEELTPLYTARPALADDQARDALKTLLDNPAPTPMMPGREFDAAWQSHKVARDHARAVLDGAA